MVAKTTSKRSGVFPRKRHHTERFRGPQLMTERWTNSKAATIGFWLGQHKSSIDVERILRDGTSSATVRAMIKKWAIPMDQARRGLLVEITPYARKLLEKQAVKVGVEPEVFLGRICDCVIRDRLYEAVTDGRYDETKSNSIA